MCAKLYFLLASFNLCETLSASLALFSCRTSYVPPAISVPKWYRAPSHLRAFAHAAPAARNTSSFTPAPTTDPLLVNSCPKLRSFLDLPSLIPKKTRPPGHVLSQHPLPPCCATQHHNNHRITSVICCKHFSLSSDKFHEVGSPAALFIALSLAHSTGPSS